MNNKEKSRIQKEIVDGVNSPHGRFILAPRVGKTKIGIDIIKKFKPKSILWVTPSAELAEKDIPEEFITWKAKRYLAKLSTVTWKSLHKMVGYYDLIILDEEQFATENNLGSIFSGQLKCKHIMSMTGTASEHDHKKELYKRLFLDIVADISINNAVDMKLLANYSIKVVEVDMSDKRDIEAGNKDKKFMTSEIKQYTYLNNIAQQAIYQKRSDMTFRILARMRAIKNSKSKTEVAKYLINKLEGRKLIFSATINQAEELCENTYHSKTDNVDLQKFLNAEIDTIAMVNAGGTGFTYKKLDHLILVQADSDKNGLTSQKISRTLLAQKDYKATIWILSLVGTQDEKWVKSTLENFDKSKVEYLRFKNLVNQEEIPLETDESLDMFKKHGVDKIQMGKDTYGTDGWITVD